MTHDEMIEVIAAHRDGKKIEFRWLSGTWWNRVSSPVWDFENHEYRIEPESKKRLLTAKKLAGKWVKEHSYSSNIILVQGFSVSGEILTDRWITIGKNMLYTDTPQDDNSWKSVEVDE